MVWNSGILEWEAVTFSSGSSHPGIEPGSPALQADSLPAELPVKPILNIICNNEELKAFPISCRTKQDWLFSPFLFNTEPEVLVRALHRKNK